MKNQYERDLTVNNSNLIIESTDKFSIAEEVGLESGDQILEINNTPLKDELDFYYLTSGDELVLSVQKPNGEIWDIEIEKDYDENLGINLKDTLTTKTCQNHCLFCFIDQMPEGMRSSLYIKDDDERLSFLNGNYVTLTNLSQSDIDRICQFKIPINISVHTTDTKLRRKILGNIRGAEILKQLQQLKDNHVEMNAQIVLVPEINDSTLEKTISDLAKFFPELKSVSVVPVGLTKYRDHLAKLRTFTNEEAINVVKIIENFQEKYIKEFNNPFVYASDEFYLLANLEIPSNELYGEYSQLENGVGMVRNFITDFDEALDEISDELRISKRIIMVTGKLFEPILKELGKKLENIFNDLNLKIIGVENKFFGPDITVTGLLTGQDILNRLKEENLKNIDAIFIPETVLRNNSEIFLDDMTITELENQLGVKVQILEEGGRPLIENLIGV